jgi:hypothetical protein
MLTLWEAQGYSLRTLTAAPESARSVPQPDTGMPIPFPVEGEPGQV